MKRCSVCGETKPLTEFYKNPQQKDGHTIWCKPCFRARQAMYNKHPPKIQTPPGTKRCTLCKEVKPEAEFFGNKNFYDGLDPACKKCRYVRHRDWADKNLDKLNEAQKRRYRANLDRYADYELKGRLNLPRGTYGKMLAAQNGKCAICGTTNPGNRVRRFSVDHCDITNVVRKLLCNRCNRGLGYFNHDASLLLAAATYLSPCTTI